MSLIYGDEYGQGFNQSPLAVAIRMANVLGLLCDERPPLGLVDAWAEGTSNDLQDWVASHLRGDVHWSSGIRAIEAAEHMACVKGQED